MAKQVFFSDYVDEDNISTIPTIIDDDSEGLNYRYLITIPFNCREGGPSALVILKNPSKAGFIDVATGKKVSDDTIYNVCDYLYKRKEKFKSVIIYNLFPVYGSTFKNIPFNRINELVSEIEEADKNERVLREVLKGLNLSDDKVILGWGGYPDLGKSEALRKSKVRELYKKQILKTLDILAEYPTYRVGNTLTDGKFPQHGKVWYDFEELNLFIHTRNL